MFAFELGQNVTFLIEEISGHFYGKADGELAQLVGAYGEPNLTEVVQSHPPPAS